MNISKTVYAKNLLADLFFSSSNVTNIQNLIKFTVHSKTSEIIDLQSDDELFIIMRSVFLSYAQFPPMLTDDLSATEREEIKTKYRQEIHRLNELVINETVPDILSQLQQYKDYLRDISTAPFIENPKNVSIKGQREYRSVTDVLTGMD
jgi:hypothetical protein